MRKCNKCQEYNEKDILAKENQLWQDMIDSLSDFTQTSTALMKEMQNKLGLSPEEDASQRQGDPSGFFQQVQEELGNMETENIHQNMCACVKSASTEDFISDEEVTPGIALYKEPTVIRKKKFKYSSEIESKIMTKKKRTPACKCNNEESSKLEVDACLCRTLPKDLKLLKNGVDELSTITVCSDLKHNEIENIYCSSEMPEDTVKNEGTSSFPWIRIPGSFNADLLPQDDDHPYVIKTEDDFHMKNKTLGYTLLEAMRKYENNIIQTDESTGEHETYSEYTRKCILLATKLRLEYPTSNIIGICTHNNANTFIPLIAGLLNGNRVAAFDRTSNKQQLTNALKNVTPHIMFVSSDCLAVLQNSMADADVTFPIVMVDECDEEATENLQRLESFSDISSYDFEAENTDNMESTCLICFDGPPEHKPVCLSHYGILRQSYKMISSKHVLPIGLSFLENYQITSLLVLFTSILQGYSTIVVREFEAEHLWTLVQKYEINVIHLYSHQLTKLSELPKQPEEDLPSLYYIFTVGERIKTSALEKMKEVLLKTLICPIYEHTEMGGIITLFDFSTPEDNLFNHFLNKSCGKPIDGMWYKVLDTESRKILNYLSSGELFVKSKCTRNGFFFKNTEDASDGNEWISTGDFVYYDTFKCFYFINKISDVIKFRGGIIFPSKLEHILLSYPMIEEAVVVPVPHHQDGQHAAAIVVVKENEDIYGRDIEDWMNTQVPEQEQLRGGVKIVSKIPYMSNGRIDRKSIYRKES